MCNWWKTCKQQIQARAPNGPHTNVQLQLKLCQQEMLFPVTESSFAQFTLFPVKLNKHSFDLRLFLSYRFRLRRGAGKLFQVWFGAVCHIPLQFPFAWGGQSYRPTCFCVRPLQWPHQNQTPRPGGWKAGPRLATRDLGKNTTIICELPES